MDTATLLKQYGTARNYSPFNQNNKGKEVGELSSATDSFIFDIAREDTTTYESETTDHTVEDLTQITDHIIVKPIIYNLKGLQGDHVSKAAGFNQVVDQINAQLGAIDRYLPGMTAGTTQAINDARNAANTAVKFVDDAIENAESAIAFGKTLKGEDDEIVVPAKQVAVAKLRKMQQSKQLLTLTTVEGDVPNLIILRLNVIGVVNSTDMLDVEVQLKQIKLANNDKFEFANAKEKVKVAEDQASAVNKKGKAEGIEVESSLFFKAL